MAAEYLLRQPEALLAPNVYPLVLLIMLWRPRMRSLLEPEGSGFEVAPAPADRAAAR